MTTRANNLPVFLTHCPTCDSPTFTIFQARGKRAYLYSRCLNCGFDQQPHNVNAQQRLWQLLPESVRATLQKPLIIATGTPCPCCGRAAA